MINIRINAQFKQIFVAVFNTDAFHEAIKQSGNLPACYCSVLSPLLDFIPIALPPPEVYTLF